MRACQKTHLKTLLKAAVFLGCLTSTQFAAAIPTQGDFDGDGLADLSVATVSRSSNSTVWTTRASSGINNLNFSFSSAADAFVSGHFYADARFFPGVVTVKSVNTPLEWRIKTPSNSENVLSYGLPGDTVPNQGDLDCDGITDLAVVRDGTGSLKGFRVWYVALSSQPGKIQEEVFGISGDKLATADLDGDSCSELIATRSDYTWFSKKLNSSSLQQVQWGVKGDLPLLPIDLNADGSADYVVVRNFGTIQYAIVRYSSTYTELYPLGASSSVPLVGRFWQQGPNFAWADRAVNQTTVRTPFGTPFVLSFGSAAGTIIRPDGTAVAPQENGGLGDDGVADVDETNGAPCTKMLPNQDGKDKFVFKPESHGTPTASAILFPATPYKSATPISNLTLWHDGKVIAKGEYRGLKHPDRPTFHFPKNGWDYGENVTLVLTLRNQQVHCIFLPDPSQRWD